MSIDTTRPSAYSNLGSAWLRDQIARLHQRHLQFRRHFCLDVDALLARAAKLTRAARAAESVTVRQHVSTDRIRLTKIVAIDHCAQLGTRPSACVAEALAD